MVLGALSALLSSSKPTSRSWPRPPPTAAKPSKLSLRPPQTRRPRHRHRNASHDRPRVSRQRSKTPTIPTYRTIILTTFARPGYLRRALDAGSPRLPPQRSSLQKSLPMPSAVSIAGMRVGRPRPRRRSLERRTKIPSPTASAQILQRAGDGRSSTEIANELHLSEGTVRNYLSEAIAKLGAANRIDAARIAPRPWLAIGKSRK